MAQCPQCVKSGGRKPMTSGDFQLVISEGVKKLNGQAERQHKWRSEIDEMMMHVRLIISQKIYQCERCNSYEIAIPEWNNKTDEQAQAVECPINGCKDIVPNPNFRF